VTGRLVLCGGFRGVRRRKANDLETEEIQRSDLREALGCLARRFSGTFAVIEEQHIDALFVLGVDFENFALRVVDFNALARTMSVSTMTFVVGVMPCHFPCSNRREQGYGGKCQRKKS
jgi:hypothetical protein